MLLKIDRDSEKEGYTRSWTGNPPVFGLCDSHKCLLLLCPHSLVHLRLEFSASSAGDGLDAPPKLCS